MLHEARRRFLQFLAIGPLAARSWARGRRHSVLSAPQARTPPISVFDYEASARQTCRAHISPASLSGRR